MNLNTSTLRDIVSENFNAARLFDSYGFDYCCHGNETLAVACQKGGVEISSVISDLDLLDTDIASQRYFSWDVSFLIDYIINNHHSYIRDVSPTILLHLQKCVAAHSRRHPELIKVEALFRRTIAELMHHMHKEEQILFPYIKHLYRSELNGTIPPVARFGKVENPINMMLAEHETAGANLSEIRELLNGYTIPEDACTTLQLAYKELEGFESDLHKHVFLENVIVFPKAIRLEKELMTEVQK